MPELPEVEIIVRQLSKKLSGRVITGFWSRPNAVLTSSESEMRKFLVGQTLQTVLRKGKYLSLVFSKEHRLWFHLGMTGQLLLKSREDLPDKHVHFVLKLSFPNGLVGNPGFRKDGHGSPINNFGNDKEKALSPLVLWFRDIRKFGEVFMTSSNFKYPNALKKLAPDPFEMKCNDFVNRFKTRSGKIKSLLLNQHLISGLGNIYANESLFRAKINPSKASFRISKDALKTLHLEIKNCLNEAILCGGSSIDDYKQTDGSRGSFQTKHQVYGRFKKSCLRCGQLIRKIMLSGRSTFYCPQCQK